MRVPPLFVFLIGAALCATSVYAWGQVGEAGDTQEAMGYQTGAVVLAVLGAMLVVTSALYDTRRRR